MTLKLKMTADKPEKNSEDPSEVKPEKSRMWKLCFYALETLVVICVLLFLGFAALLARIHAAPLDVSFAKDYVLAQVQEAESDTVFAVESIALYWPKLSEDLYLSVSDLSVLDADQNALISVDQVAVGLDKSLLFLGRVRPQVLVVQSPTLSVTRDAQGDFDIGFGAMQTDLDTRSVVSEETIAQQILNVFYTKGSNEVLSKLQTLEIWDATVQVRDDVNDVGFDLERTDFIVTRYGAGLVASAKVSLPNVTPEDPAVGIYADIIIPLKTKQVKMDIRVRHLSAGFLSSFAGAHADVLRDQSGLFDLRADLALDGDFNPQLVDGFMVSQSGVLTVPDFYPAGLPYQDLNLELHYNQETRMLLVENSGVTLRDVPVQLGADFVWNDGELTGPVRVDIEALSHDQLKQLWPESLKEDNSYEWAAVKITKARFTQLFAQFYARVGQDVETQSRHVDVENLLAGFHFDGAQVNYRAPLTPVTHGKGAMVFDLDQERIDVDVKAARLLDMDIPKADLIFTDIIDAGQGDLDIKIKLQGPLKSAFVFIQDEPIGAQTDVEIAGVQGQTDMDIHIVLPLLKDLDMSDVQLNLAGQARDVVLPGVVRGLALTGGPFDVSIKKNLLKVAGQGKLNGRAVDAVYEQYLISAGKSFRSRIQAKIDADPALRQHFGIVLDDFLSGSVPVDVTYMMTSPTQARIDVNGDLRQSRLFIDAFQYEKPVGVNGMVEVQAFLQNDKIQDIKNLSVTAPGLALRHAQLGFTKEELSRGSFPFFEVGQTKGKIDFNILPSGEQRISMEASFLDLRPFLDKDEKADPVYNDPPRKISVSAAQMRSSDQAVISDGKMYIDINSQGKFNQMEMDAVAGDGAIYLRYKPDDSGKRVFRLEADDAGATLQAFDLYDKIRGGKMVIYGEPIKGVFDRNLVGIAEITNFSVVKAPGLAKLLGAMSLPGVLNLLNNEGLSFAKLEANFNWLYRRNGSLLVVKDGRTSGNSVGFTFDGTFDNAANQMDLSGTIVPLSGINNLVSNIPLVGQILSGGTDSVFAATYTMKGAGDDPKISVNPLAALTPGILRRIFFEQK